MYYVYILQSAKDSRFYIGCTSMEPVDRLNYHNRGSVKSTRPRRPFKLIYQEGPLDKGTAFKREWYLKHPAGYIEKQEIINKYLGA